MVGGYEWYDLPDSGDSKMRNGFKVASVCNQGSRSTKQTELGRDKMWRE